MAPLLQSGSSFRDPAGYVLHEGKRVKRAVTERGVADYRLFTESGLYSELVSSALLVAHTEEPIPEGWDIAKLLKPERIPFISYPYEWSFGQLRDAALLTLNIQEKALRRSMSLKDASAFNVQFHGTQPIFIDTLSFEPDEAGPWVAYNQFCRHFIAPLLLMSHVSPRFNTFFRTTLDGFALDLAAAALPWKARLSVGNLLHIFLHARAQKKYQGRDAELPKAGAAGQPDRKMALVESLRSCVESIRPWREETEWANYYESNTAHYSGSAERSKKALVARVLETVRPGVVLDLGGNIGTYGRLANEAGAYCICCDIDPLCVHRNYETSRREKNRRMLPLLLDVANPTPALGFALDERSSFLSRGESDLVMALALVHHLRISANVPMNNIAAFLAQLGPRVLVEHVPKSDPMAQALLRSRRDTFHDYTDAGFRAAFEPHFKVEAIFPITETDRTLYLFQRRSSWCRT